jgi:toxin ParE1/3/4
VAEVVWTEPALSQLEEIFAYIALDKPGAAQAVARRIFAETQHLARFLRLGRRIPEVPYPQYRQVWITPCWFYYRIDGENALILHVRRGDMLFNPEELLKGEA